MLGPRDPGRQSTARGQHKDARIGLSAAKHEVQRYELLGHTTVEEMEKRKNCNWEASCYL